MKPSLDSISVDRFSDNARSQEFCQRFFEPATRRYVFGRNEYAMAIAELASIEAFIDDFTSDTEYLGCPIIRSDKIPRDAMVVSVVIGRPFVAEKRLRECSVDFLDYFSFARYAKPFGAKPVKFWEDFRADFERNRSRYEWIHGLLCDDESRSTFERVIQFRLSHDLEFMRGFTDAQHRQYFESFLQLERHGESFADVGSYDGYTSEYFIRECPEYAAVHVFEPEPKNIEIVRRRLGDDPRIHYYEHGLSDRSETLRFSPLGSCSRIAADGTIEIRVERLDDTLRGKISFLKMDIEGAEIPALRGAKETLLQQHPRIAVSVYHLYDDLWKIPEQILSFRADYRIFLRHYTEGVDETVMFFIPDRGPAA